VNQRLPTRRRAAGFTLIEMVITVAIIGILTATAVATVDLAVTRSREQDLRQALRDIRLAIDKYKQASDDGRIITLVQESGYPPSLRALVDGVEDARSPTKAKMYFMRSLPRDPLGTDMQGPPEDTWILRSYASEPDSPAAGKDVFDVHSRADGVGLNGIAYQKW
jgi:general secretion pathway protein G